MNEIIIAKPLIKITTYDDVYFTEATEAQLLEILNDPNKNFISFDGKGIHKKQIKSYEKHDGMGYEFLPKVQRVAVEEMINKYYSTLREWPSQKAIQGMITKATNGAN